MPVPIICTACSARLIISDDLFERKFRGRRVTIGCRRCGADVVVDSTRKAAEGTGRDDLHRPVAPALDLDEGPTLVYESRPPGPGESVPEVAVAKPDSEPQE